MLEIQPNNLIIDNPAISSDLFKVFIMMIENIDICKKLSEVYDMLCFNEKYDIIKSYYCIKPDCMKIKSKDKYCEVHASPCEVNNCKNDKYENNQYCEYHICSVKNCGKYNNGIMYCKKHDSCSFYHCNQSRKYAQKSNVHGYCEECSCIIDNCNRQSASGSKFCHNHKCYTGYCYSQCMDNSIYCKRHTV